MSIKIYIFISINIYFIQGVLAFFLSIIHNAPYIHCHRGIMSKFKYKNIEETILNDIRNGFLKPGDKLPAARVYAKSYGTSEITVNKALNHLAQKGFIERVSGVGSIVLNADVSAADTIQKTFSHLIGVIVFDISHPFWAGIIRGIEEVCRTRNFNLLVGNDEGNLSRAEQYIQNYIHQGVEGIIFVPIGSEDKKSYEEENRRLIEIIEQSGIKYTLLHRKIESYYTSIVQFENYKTAYEAAKILLMAGSENPICISQYYSHVVMEREKGFLDALKHAGFRDAEDRIYHLHPLGQTVSVREMKEVQNILTSDLTVDGILTITADMLKLAALVEDAQMLPKKKIISFDYNPMMYKRDNILAMFETLNIDMGKLAAELLINKLSKDFSFDIQTSISPVFHAKECLKEKIEKNHFQSNKFVFHN